jgi:serine/threonine-protein kinase
VLQFTDLLHVGRTSAVYHGLYAGVCGFERPVAIKVLRPSFAAQPPHVQAFFAEARSAARVRHPSVVDVHALVESEAGTALVMELVDGWSLRTLLSTTAIRRRAVPIDIATAIVAAAAESVAAVHDVGLLHRDLVPDNLLVTRSGHVVLIDFGGAIPIKDGESSSRVATTARDYAAPELIAGRTVDRRADVYSLATILYTLITHAADGEASVPLLPPEALEAVILAATAANPEDRPETAGELERELETAVDLASRSRVASFLDKLFEPEATPAPVRNAEMHLADLPVLESRDDTRIRFRRI